MSLSKDLEDIVQIRKILEKALLKMAQTTVFNKIFWHFIEDNLSEQEIKEVEKILKQFPKHNMHLTMTPSIKICVSFSKPKK